MALARQATLGLLASLPGRRRGPLLGSTGEAALSFRRPQP
jgi:hypothetical protein